MLLALLPTHSGADVMTAPLSGSRWLTAWSFAPVPAAALAISAALYLLGVHRMRIAGNPWPVGRTIAFVGGGLGSALIATCSPLAAYDEVLLSVHMVQHMILAMITPIFIALGAPVTLALRTLPRGRRLILAVVHSRVAAVLTFPVVAGALFIANPFALYFSGLYEQTLRHEWLHELIHLHFVVVGCLWYVPLIGIDPLPRRASYPIRVLSAFVTLPFHAWLGVAIMSMNTLIAGDWYLAHHRDWGSSPLADQRTAGGILWSSGDLVGLIVFAALFVQWVRASQREARREDRRLDRLDAEEMARARRNAGLAGASGPLPSPQGPAGGGVGD